MDPYPSQPQAPSQPPQPFQPQQPPRPTEPYPHHNLPLEIPQPPSASAPEPVPAQPVWNSQPPQPTFSAAPQPGQFQQLPAQQPHLQQQHHQPQPQPVWPKPRLKMPTKMPAFMQVASSALSGKAATSQFDTPTPGVPDADPTPVSLGSTGPTQPVPVVRVLSPVGVEYVFLTLTLFTGAIGLASVLIALVNGKLDFAVLSFPAATLLVSVPIFAKLFLHLKKQELLHPALKLDPSKRRSTQFSQIISFTVCFFTLIGLVFAIFAKMGGEASFSIFKAILDSLCVLVVAGGILAYYWNDEHKG